MTAPAHRSAPVAPASVPAGASAVDETARYRHGRVPRDVRERQVLALAEQLFAERGYRGASMDELARRAGVSKPVLYDLFANKQELHRRVFELAADDLATSVAAAAGAHAATLSEQLGACAIAFFAFIDEHRMAWSMLYDDDDGGGVHAPHVRDIRERQTAFVREMLGARAAAGGAALDERRLEAAARMVNGAFEWLAAWWRDRQELTAAELADWLMALLLPGLRELLGDAS